MRRVEFGRRLVVGSLLFGLVAACGGDGAKLPLSLSLYGPSEDGQRPLLSFPIEVQPLIDELVVTAYQGDRVIGESTRVDVSEGTVRLPNLPLGEDLWISIEAFGDVPACADTCATAGNGSCEDGRDGSDASTCLPGTDCTDCNVRQGDLRTRYASGASPRFAFDGKSEGVSLNVAMLRTGRFTPGFRFDPDASLSQPLVYELPETRAGAAVAQLPESGAALLVGGALMGPAGTGQQGTGILELRDTMEFYNPETGTFLTLFDEAATGLDPQTSALRLPKALAFATATAIDETTIVIAGGLQFTTVGADILAEANGDIYVVRLTGEAEGTLEVVESAGQRPRMFHTSTLLPDGRVVLAGGVGGAWETPFFQANVETIELVGGEIAYNDTGVTLQVPRAGHTATYFASNDHGIFLAGGKVGEAIAPASEVLYAEGLSFGSEVLNAGNGDQDLSVPRFGHGAARFSCPTSGDEYVAIVGGFTAATGPSQIAGASPTSVIEIYDPSSRFDATTGNTYRVVRNDAGLAQARAFATVVGLELSADVLVAGGVDGNGNVLGTAERFFNNWNPCDQLFGPGAVSGLGSPRAYANAFTLPSRAVMVTAGTDGSSSLESSVFFNPDDYFLVREAY